MIKYALFWLALGSCLLSGCASHTVKQDDVNSQLVNFQESLAQAARTTSSALDQLSVIDKAQYSNDTGMPLAHVHAQSLAQPTALQWYGPVEPVLAKIAKQVSYQFQVYGKAPSIPLLVDVDTKKHPISAIAVLRNLDVQLGDNASLMVLTKTKIISLRYLD